MTRSMSFFDHRGALMQALRYDPHRPLGAWVLGPDNHRPPQRFARPNSGWARIRYLVVCGARGGSRTRADEKGRWLQAFRST